MKSLARKEWYGALVAVLVLGILLSIASPYFLTGRNLSNILVQASVIALLAGGQTFVILTGGVDLAVGSLTALAGAVAGYMMIQSGIDPYLSIAAAIAIGAAVGLFNGYLVAFVGIPSLPDYGSSPSQDSGATVQNVIFPPQLSHAHLFN